MSRINHRPATIVVEADAWREADEGLEPTPMRWEPQPLTAGDIACGALVAVLFMLVLAAMLLSACGGSTGTATQGQGTTSECPAGFICTLEVHFPCSRLPSGCRDAGADDAHQADAQ